MTGRLSFCKLLWPAPQPASQDQPRTVYDVTTAATDPTTTPGAGSRLGPVTLVMAVTSGLAVANLYYAQPLLDLIARDFDVTQGAAAVVITGGHVIGPVHEGGDVVDLLFDGETFTELKARRVAIDPGHGMHGTGCAFASALAAGLALGEPLAEAAGRAQRYVAGAMAHRIAIGRGAPVLNHFWQIQSANQ